MRVFALIVTFEFQDSGLMHSEVLPSENMTSAERSLRHGEVKLLRSMRQSYREAGPRKRRVLKLDVWEIEGAEVEEPGDIDIKDVEFRLSNNSKQLQASHQTVLVFTFLPWGLFRLWCFNVGGYLCFRTCYLHL